MATNGLAMAIMQTRRVVVPLLFAVLMSSQASAQGEPPAVRRLSVAVLSVPGVATAEIGKTYLPDIKVAELSLPGPFAELPIAALRRSNGGLPNELLISINFTIQRNESGLKALEFLSWWARDQSRGGENVQLRSIGLPPIAGATKQLGTTLRFSLDWFYTSQSQDMSVVLRAIEDKAQSLELARKLYGSAF